jgi:general secretion pathway protein D
MPAIAPPVTAPPATAPPATAPPATAPLLPGLPPATAPPPPDGPPPTAPAAVPRVYFQPSQATAGPSERITASLFIDGAADVASAPMQIQFDSKLLRLNDVSLGDFFSKDGRQPVFTKNILNDTGMAIIQLNRLPGSPGLGGSGTLVTLNFQAVASGAAVVTIPHLTVRNAQGAIISNSTPQFTVMVK